ncbi:MAG: cyclodeaminase/cyclohydrolase family protein [Anaerolineae bacterium]|nr:cyclodeaminase/cyclohydrolase family protein [Anaerolineae bacterium]
MTTQMTGKTVQQFVKEIGDQHHVLAGTVIATSAAQAAALGEACMQISLDYQVDTLDWQDVTTRIGQMVDLKNRLLEWADQAATLTAEVETEASDRISAEVLQKVFEIPAEVTRLCLAGVFALQAFRPLVLNRLAGNLTIAVRLLLGGAEAALLLLQTELTRWEASGPAAAFGDLLAELSRQVASAGAIGFD